MMPVAVIVGANSDRRKFANKSVRAHASAGYVVYAVHPTESVVEERPAFATLQQVPENHLDRVTLYLPPPVLMKVLPTWVGVSIGELWFNPGTDTPDILGLAGSLGFRTVAACSIVDLGFSPDQFPDA